MLRRLRGDWLFGRALFALLALLLVALPAADALACASEEVAAHAGGNELTVAADEPTPAAPDDGREQHGICQHGHCHHAASGLRDDPQSLGVASPPGDILFGLTAASLSSFAADGPRRPPRA